MAKHKPRLREPGDTLQAIKRGLAGYISYLSACRMSSAFSEYVLYEPILRILKARRYSVKCEYICPGVQQPPTGDKKRVDFFATWKPAQNEESVELAIEVKWAKTDKLDVTKDAEKLDGFCSTNSTLEPLLCVFGRKAQLEDIELKGALFEERGEPIFTEFGKSRFGCRIFKLKRAQMQSTSKPIRSANSRRASSRRST